MLWYLLKPKTRLLTSRTKLNLRLENQYTNTDVWFNVIDHRS